MYTPLEGVLKRAVTQNPWIFGYGSLMWRPGFNYLERRQATLYGYHRSFCVFSHVHRGTPDKPGLVFGLDRGGSCRGLAYRVDTQVFPEVVDYLRKREQVTMIYKEVEGSVQLTDRPASKVPALFFIVDREHHQYAGKVAFDTQVSMIANAVGQSGENPDYLQNTVTHLNDMGIYDQGLNKLWQAVEERLEKTA